MKSFVFVESDRRSRWVGCRTTRLDCRWQIMISENGCRGVLQEFSIFGQQIVVFSNDTVKLLFGNF